MWIFEFEPVLLFARALQVEYLSYGPSKCVVELKIDSLEQISLRIDRLYDAVLTRSLDKLYLSRLERTSTVFKRNMADR